MKSHFDPNNRPIQGPSDDDPQEPYLAEQDLPQDSFGLEDDEEDTHLESQNNNLEPMEQITPQESHDDATSDPDPFADLDVFQIECILKTRESKGKREYLLKWHTTRNLGARGQHFQPPTPR